MTAPQSVRRLKRMAIAAAIIAVMVGASIRDVRIDRQGTPHPGAWVVFRGRVVARVLARPELGSVQFNLIWSPPESGAAYNLINVAIGHTTWFQIGR